MELEIAKRYPRIYEKVSESIIDNQHIATSKVSLKYEKVLHDSLKKGEIYTGEYHDTKAECTIPFLSQAKFLKFQMTHRKYFDIFSLSKHF